jgi:hypothetical protein
MADNIAKEDHILSKALEVKNTIASQLMANPNVTGVGVGYKIVKGKRTEEVCIRVYVRKKLPKQELRPEEILPESIEGIPVDVIESRPELLQGGSEPPIEGYRRRRYPLVGGISVGNLTLGGSGTIGVSVFDNVSGEDMILSNWHVLCGRPDCTPGEPIIQPGTGDGDSGGSGDLVARLHRFALTDEVDAAIARFTGHRFLLKEVLGLGTISEVGTAALGMRERKSGRTTGVTVGMVTDISADVLGHRNQIVVEADEKIGDRGDSGSIWIDDSNRVVGLLFAGEVPSGERIFANPISAVLQALNINLRIGVTMQDFIAVTSNVLL